MMSPMFVQGIILLVVALQLATSLANAASGSRTGTCTSASRCHPGGEHLLIQTKSHGQFERHPANSAKCRTAEPGELCYRAVTWARDVGIFARPNFYQGLTDLSPLDDFQQFLYDQGDHQCGQPPCQEEPMPADCQTAEVGERCFGAVDWVKRVGILHHPDWYPALSPASPSEAVQWWLHETEPDVCPQPPCIACHTAREGEPCYEEVIWAMNEGMETNPRSYPGLTSSSTFEDFQQFIYSTCEDGGYCFLPPCPACLTATEGNPKTEACYSKVTEAMARGVIVNPEAYHGLAAESSFEEFQVWLHVNHPDECPTRPCSAPTLTTTTTTMDHAGHEPVQAPVLVEQAGALLPAGSEIRMFTVGTSNVGWQTWPDQVHVMLKELGYTVTKGPEHGAEGITQQPLKHRLQECDDADKWSNLETPRFARIGWNSWGFAYETKEDCDSDNHRTIAGHHVSCINGWACNPHNEDPGWPLVPLSKIADAARHSDLVLLSTWVNDAKHRWHGNLCYKGAGLSHGSTANISADGLRRTIAAIREVNAESVVLVMASYPQSANYGVNRGTAAQFEALNADVEAQLRGLRRTYFVGFSLPADAEVFQRRSPGHPNCRGDRAMATKVLEVLFRQKVLARGLDLGSPGACVDGVPCRNLSPQCCQRSAVCFLDSDGLCAVYGPGRL